MTALIAYTTVPDQGVADRLAHTLVSERLAACVSRVPSVVSTYRWQGTVEAADEVLLVIKTRRERFDALRERLVALHPYELPELVAVDVAAGHPPYLDWIARETIGGRTSAYTTWVRLPTAGDARRMTAPGRAWHNVEPATPFAVLRSSAPHAFAAHSPELADGHDDDATAFAPAALLCRDRRGRVRGRTAAGRAGLRAACQRARA